MHLEDRLDAFHQLGIEIGELSETEIENLTQAAQAKNGWFTKKNIQEALYGVSFMLSKEKLTKWIEPYSFISNPKIIGIIQPGNIPLVGFHDLLSVLVSGHFAAVKPSQNDEILMKQIIQRLLQIEPRFKKQIEIQDKLTDIDALIATGSDNTARYFDYYFRDTQRIIRKNRTSVAVLTGDETEAELERLGDDLFSYFGLGCRNVSKVFTPEGYDIKEIFSVFERHKEIIHHHKYRNNYDYYKSIFLVNQTPHLDTGFLLVSSSDDLVSPVSILYHQEYNSSDNFQKILKLNEDKIQCVVGKTYTPFGTTQQPELWDYADQVDTLNFLSRI